MTREELDKIIELHQHWLKQDCEGWEDMKANLYTAKLRGANLSFADLRGADLRMVDLREADLSFADLSGADLREADLRAANLHITNLAETNLRSTDLRGADLSEANLHFADLLRADLRGADLIGANLRGANLRMANFCEANLSEANFNGANLGMANLSPADRFRLGQILTEPFTGYKKTNEGVVITAEIPVGAIVFCINGSRCRTNRAKITDMAGHDVLHSQYDTGFEYHLGQEINIEDFNLMYNVECASGFHFFRTREEAEDYKC